MRDLDSDHPVDTTDSDVPILMCSAVGSTSIIYGARGIMAEDPPEESSRVVLHDSPTDSDGIPAAEIVHNHSENTRRLSEFHLARATEAMETSGTVAVMHSMA